MENNSYPSVGVFRVQEPGQEPKLAFWCRACCAVHIHGAALAGGAGAHCSSRLSPFFRSGYNFDLVGEASSLGALVPAAPLAGKRSLAVTLEDAGVTLAKSVFRALIGRPNPGLFWKTIEKFTVKVFQLGDAWSIERDGYPKREGFDLLSLISEIYGSSSGNAALMTLEAAFGVSFDRKTAISIVRAIDGWRMDGSPSRDRRPARGHLWDEQAPL